MTDTPAAYAKRLAGYIASPTKIESLTKLEFGRAPPLHEIAQMRVRVEQEAKQPYCQAISDAKRDGAMDQDYRVKGLVKTPRVRDYIVLGPPQPVVLQPEPPADNPFIGRVSLTKRLAKSVAIDFDIPVEPLLARSRLRRVVDARAVLINLLARRGYGMAEIGRRLGKDHSTIIHAVNNFSTYERRNPDVTASWQRHLKLIAEADALRAKSEAHNG